MKGKKGLWRQPLQHIHKDTPCLYWFKVVWTSIEWVLSIFIYSLHVALWTQTKAGVLSHGRGMYYRDDISTTQGSTTAPCNFTRSNNKRIVQTKKWSMWIWGQASSSTQCYLHYSAPSTCSSCPDILWTSGVLFTSGSSKCLKIPAWNPAASSVFGLSWLRS